MKAAEIHEVYRPEAVELHLCARAQFTRVYGKRVKAAGGTYSAVRGSNVHKRYVQVPIAERELINELLDRYRGGKLTTVVFRNFNRCPVSLPSWVVVKKAPRVRGLDVALDELQAALDKAKGLGLLVDGDVILAERQAEAEAEERADAKESECMRAIDRATTPLAFGLVSRNAQAFDSVRRARVDARILERLREVVGELMRQHDPDADLSGIRAR
jgi:hypothetical protein